MTFALLFMLSFMGLCLAAQTPAGAIRIRELQRRLERKIDELNEEIEREESENEGEKRR